MADNQILLKCVADDPINSSSALCEVMAASHCMKNDKDPWRHITSPDHDELNNWPWFEKSPAVSPFTNMV